MFLFKGYCFAITYFHHSMSLCYTWSLTVAVKMLYQRTISFISDLYYEHFCRSSEDQEALFDQILMGQLEFPLPYWDNVSETAKVSNFLTASRCEEDDVLPQKQAHPPLFVSAGSDPVHAWGGGGPEIHCPAGAGASLGYCKYSICEFVKLSFLQKHWLANLLINVEWGSVWKRTPAVCSGKDKEALQYWAQGQRHQRWGVSHFCK